MGVSGHNKILAAVTAAGVLGLGGGAAYAVGPTLHDKTNQVRTAVAVAPAVETTAAAQVTAPASTPGATAVPLLGPLPLASPEAPASPTRAAVPTAEQTTPTVAAKPTSRCQTGEHQRAVEEALSQLRTYGPIVVDGVQTDEDCQTIVNFQRRFGIQPAEGRAGPLTAGAAERIRASTTSAERAACGAGPGLTACVDLTLQTVWVVRDGTVVFGPTVVRTGMAGYATPAGSYRISERLERAWSEPYKVWLPYWQRIVRDMGFHATTTYIHDMPSGSHGCVNLLPDDALTLYNTITMGTPVKVFGRRAGT